MISTFFRALSLLLLLVGKASAQSKHAWTLTMEMDENHCNDEHPSVVPITIKWYDQDLTQISWYNGDDNTIDRMTQHDTVIVNCQDKTWGIATLLGTTVRNVIVSIDGDNHRIFHGELLVFKKLTLDHGGPADAADGFPKSWDNFYYGSYCLSKDDNDYNGFIEGTMTSVGSACQPSIEFYGQLFYYNVFFYCKIHGSNHGQDFLTLELYDKHGILIQKTRWSDEWDTYCSDDSELTHRTVELTFSHHIYEVKLKTSGTDALQLDVIHLEKAENVDVGVATPKNKISWGQGPVFSFCLSKDPDKWLDTFMCRSDIRLCVQDCSSEFAKTSFENQQFYRTVVDVSEMKDSGSADKVLLQQHGQKYKSVEWLSLPEHRYFDRHRHDTNFWKHTSTPIIERPDYVVVKASGGDALLLDRVYLLRVNIAFPVRTNGSVSTAIIHDFLSGNGGYLGKYLCLSTEPDDYGVDELGSERVGNTCLESFTFVFPWSSILVELGMTLVPE